MVCANGVDVVTVVVVVVAIMVVVGVVGVAVETKKVIVADLQTTGIKPLEMMIGQTVFTKVK